MEKPEHSMGKLFAQPGQASFLRETIQDGADQAEVADELKVGLHARH